MFQPALNKLRLVTAHILPWHCRYHCSNENYVTNDEDHISNRKGRSDDCANATCFCVFKGFFSVDTRIVAVHFNRFIAKYKSNNSTGKTYDTVAPAKYDRANSQYKHSNMIRNILLHSHWVSTHRISAHWVLLVRILLIRISLWWWWRERRILIFHGLV